MANLKKIFIRARRDEKWESLSLKELYNIGEAGQVFEWALEKLNSSQVVHLTEENLSAMVDLMESLGITIVKLK